MSAPLDLFAACLPGLEPLLARELESIGVRGGRVERGGVAFAGHRNAVMRANLELGLASHVLVRVAHFNARGLGELSRKCAAVDWRRFLPAGSPLGMRIRSQRSRLYHSGAIEERVRVGIAERQKAPVPPPLDTGAAALVVRFERDECTLSLDTSGPPLHRRGWRLAGAKAPLREDIARALVMASGWDGETPLVDPLCGSGTVAIEAALIARRRAPGRGRKFAFERTALHDAPTWERVQAESLAKERTVTSTLIAASDRDAGAIEAARSNAERAGVLGDIRFVHAAVSDAPYLCGEPAAPPKGWVVTNPPYGKRVGTSHELAPLFQTLGERVRGLPESWTLALLAADSRLARRCGVPLRTAFLTDHGGLKVRALVSGPETGPAESSVGPTDDDQTAD